MPSSSAGIGGAWVFIKLASNDASNSDYNRIWLQAETVGITTGKTVAAMPIPFSGLATGESTSLALDLGMASKTFNISGTLVEQEIKKKFKDNVTTADSGVAGGVTRKMTAQEVAQLLHSYVDSSFLQDQQNMNELIIVYPSYVNKNWEYHTGLDANSELEDAKMMPFNYGVRDGGTVRGLDARGSAGGTDFPTPIDTDTGEINGVKGFIRTFTTTFEGSPFVQFTMDFEVAITIGF
jgi:hypothetical protein|tara:strand:+ start:465 stop:1175 length:711 start_codon:yes stop_codon:yes gene_type:complete